MKLRLVPMVHLPGIKHPIHVRRGTSDTGTFRQVFKEDQYKFNLKGPINSIIDAGANIGLASIVFANKYPEARITAVEPDSGNFQLLKKNVSDYNVYCLFGGVWNKSTHLEVVDNGWGEWAYMVRETSDSNPNATQAYDMNEIMQKSNFEQIDILKVDIEGSEKELFEKAYDVWLPKTKYIIIEMHDSMKPGSSRSAFAAISKYNFSFQSRRENLLFTNEDLIRRDA